MTDLPKYITIGQARKVSGMAKSSIISRIDKGLYGKVEKVMQGKRPAKQILVTKFIEVCENEEVELDWSTIAKSTRPLGNRSKTDQATDTQTGRQPSNNNDLKATLEALEQQYQVRLAEKDKELERAVSEAQRAKDEAVSERQQAVSEREQAAAERELAAIERRELNQARNFFEAQRNFLLGRIEGLGRGDGWRLLTGRKLRLELPAQPQSDTDDEIIDAETEDVTVSNTKTAAQT